MEFSQKVIEYLESKKVSNLLFLNDLTITPYNLITLNNLFSNIYVTFSNSFTLKTYYSKLKNCKNIHIVEQNHIPLINYDFVSIDELNPLIEKFLNKITSLKILYVSSLLNIKTPDGFKKNINFKNLFEKNNIINQNVNKELNNINQNQNIKNNKNLISVSKNAVYAKNICPIKNIFTSNNFKYFIKEGQLDVFCILESSEDVTKFKDVLNYLNENYKNSKLYIVFNGITGSKAGISKFNHILIESSIKEDINKIKNFLNNMSNGSFRINFNKINTNKNILDLINEDCINITNI